MPLNNISVSRVVNASEVIYVEIKNTIAAWAQSIPHHPYMDFENSLLVNKILYRPAHLNQLTVQYERRVINSGQMPYCNQAAGVIPDISKPFQIPLRSSISGFENKEADQTFFGNVYRCASCEGRGSHTCERCKGMGSLVCPRCSGEGRNQCISCNGSGNLSHCSNCNWWGQVDKRCWSCRGTGMATSERRCTECNNGYYKDTCDVCGGTNRPPCSCNDGFDTCSPCRGSGNLECTSCLRKGHTICGTCSGAGWVIDFAEVIQVFYVVKSDVVVKGNCLPAKYDNIQLNISHANSSTAKVIQEATLLPATITSGSQAVDALYYALQSTALAGHAGHTRILRENYSIWEVDVYEVKCSYAGRDFTIWVYGNQMTVLDGGSPIKKFRDELLRQASDDCSKRRFPRSYHLLIKARSMHGIVPEKFEAAMLLSLKRRLNFLHNIGLVTALMLILYLLPTLAPFYRSLLAFVSEGDLYDEDSVKIIFGIGLITTLLATLLTFGLRWLYRRTGVAFRGSSTRGILLTGASVPIAAFLVVHLFTAALVKSNYTDVFYSFGEAIVNGAPKLSTTWNNMSFRQKQLELIGYSAMSTHSFLIKKRA